MGVMLLVQSEKGPVLTKYLNFIHRAYCEYAGAAWLQYNEMFKTRAVMDPSLPWGQEHQQLWSKCMGTAVAIMVYYTGSGHLVVRSVGDTGQGVLRSSGFNPTLLVGTSIQMESAPGLLLFGHTGCLTVFVAGFFALLGLIRTSTG